MSVIEFSPAVTPIEVAEPNEAQRILLAARDLIADESRWCIGAWTRDGTYCALGAVGSALGIPDDRLTSSEINRRLIETDTERYLEAAASDLIPDFERSVFEIVEFNDMCDHATVMCLFNRAIQLAGRA